MSDLGALFLNNLLPIFLAAAAGYPLARWLNVDPKPISQVVFYVFSPALVFVLITENKLENADILIMMVFATIVMLVIGMLTFGVGRLLRFERQMLSAVVIASVFMNAGNYGLPLNLFAFGETALAYAGLYFVTMAILTNTVGVVIASMGSRSFSQALRGLFHLPAIYALLIGFLFSQTGRTLPLPIDRTINLLADAAIPSMLLLLGLQFHKAQWKGQVVPISLVTGMRLVVAPVLALGLSLLFRLEGPAHQAAVLESAMPTAVMMTILATEFNVMPAFVTTTVYISTLISPITLTLLLFFLSR